MNTQRVTLLVLLDLSAAFDTIDHQILRERLYSSFGFSDSVLSWFSSYLSCRFQRISIDGKLSRAFTLKHGVPQGSCLGPVLFTMYAKNLFKIIQQHLPVGHGYADDTQLHLAFSPDSRVHQEEAVSAMENCIYDIKKWMESNKLKLNDSKTEFLIIGTRQQLAKVTIDHLNVGSSEIKPSSSARNLGSWFDRNLNMEEHVSKICKTAFYYLYNIRRIRKFLTRKDTETLIHAFISSRLDFCNSLLYGMPDSLLQKLQRIQNAAARLVTLSSRFERITPILHELHWLPVKLRIIFKVCVITFKSIHGQAPLYLQNLTHLRSQTRYSLRSQNEILLQKPTFKSLSTLGDRSFLIAAVNCWNKLPKHVRSHTDIESFKKALKTHLFNLHFNFNSNSK